MTNISTEAPTFSGVISGDIFADVMEAVNFSRTTYGAQITVNSFSTETGKFYTEVFLADAGRFGERPAAWHMVGTVFPA
jgi:hypothetical protein